MKKKTKTTYSPFLFLLSPDVIVGEHEGCAGCRGGGWASTVGARPGGGFPDRPELARRRCVPLLRVGDRFGGKTVRWLLTEGLGTAARWGPYRWAQAATRGFCERGAEAAALQVRGGGTLFCGVGAAFRDGAN